MDDFELDMIRTSERSEYCRCRWRWNLHANVGVRPKIVKPALRFGTLWHVAMAEYYQPGRKRGPHPAKTFKRIYSEEMERFGKYGIKDQDEEEWIDAGDMGIAMAENYVDTYGRDLNIEVVEPEHPYFWKIKDSGGVVHIEVGRFDAVIRLIDVGEVGLFEHKTASSLGETHLALDNQVDSYWAFGNKHLRKIGVLKDGQSLDMVLYNEARKAKPDPRPTNDLGQRLNKDGSVSKTQPPPYFKRTPLYRDEEDTKATLKRIRQVTWEMRMARTGKLPIYKNPLKMFGSTCGDCDLRDACELHETGSDWEEYIRQNYETGVDGYSEYKRDYAKYIAERSMR